MTYRKPTKPGPYIARTASDRNPDWPIWYVAGPDGRSNYLTGIGQLIQPIAFDGFPAIFADKDTAIALADEWNKA
jgi:hypothetical protein